MAYAGIDQHLLDALYAPFSGVLRLLRMHRRQRVGQIGHFAHFATVETGLLSVMTEMVALSDATPYGDNVRFGKVIRVWVDSTPNGRDHPNRLGIRDRRSFFPAQSPKDPLI